MALPALYSTPVLFYNKNAFRKAKLDPEQPPKTWFEMQGMLDKLQEAGYACPYTTSWPVWVHIDNVSALSGVPAVGDKGQLNFNGLPQVKHIAMMITWTKANYFKHFGRRDEGSAKFQDGECAMITTDSREAVDFQDAKGVELGVAPMPYHDDVYGGRQHTLADGATLWVGAGRTPAEYKQAAKFVSWLLSPEMQIETVRLYGGLPLTPAARSAARSKILKDSDRTLEIAYASMKGKGASSVPHVADIDAVRIITNEELEAAWADKKPAKAALDTAVSRGSAVPVRQSGAEEVPALLMRVSAAALDCPSRWRESGAGKYPGRHSPGGQAGLPGGRVRRDALGGRHAGSDSRRNAGTHDQWRRPGLRNAGCRSLCARCRRTASAFPAFPKPRRCAANSACWPMSRSSRRPATRWRRPKSSPA